MSTDTVPLVDIRDLVVSFSGGRAPVRAVSGVSLQVRRGQTVALIGESGSCKSVTLRTLLMLHPARRTRLAGAVRVAGHDVLAMAERQLADYRGAVASMIFQEPLLELDPVYTVGEQIIEAIRRHEPAVRAAEARQRAMIGLALACRPQLLLADEPTTPLDATVQIQVLILLRELPHDLGLSIVFVTHDIGAALEVADRIPVMYAGRIVEEGTARERVRAPRYPYTLALLRGRAHGAMARGQRLVTIGGSPPDLGRLPPGCAFAERCALVQDACRRRTPEAVIIAPGHQARCLRTDATRAAARRRRLSHRRRHPIVLARSGIKTRHAATVQVLLDAGARFVGKTVTDEFAFSMNGINAHFGAPVNGAAPDRISGGSSSGSASAVSHRLCDFALGTDTGGSVRAPASHCGLYGLRPTHGRVSLAGAMDLSPSLDTCGWFARDAGTFARVSDVLLGPDTAPAPVRLLWPEDLWPLLAPAARPAAESAAQRMQQVLGTARPVRVVLDDIDAMYWHFRHLQGREAWMTNGPLIERHAPPLGPGVAERFAWSQQVSDAQVAAATAFRTRFKARLAELLGDDGVLLLPTMPDIAPRRDEPEASLEDYRNRAIRLLCGAGLAGAPHLSLPLARRDGAPLGLSLLGRPGIDRALVAMAERLAAAGLAP